MSDVFSTVVLGKLYAAAGGLVGGLMMFAFMKPKSILDATIRGGMCTALSIIFSPFLLNKLGIVPGVESSLAAGTFIGFIAWGTLSMIARFFIKAEQTNTDITEVIPTIKK